MKCLPGLWRKRYIVEIALFVLFFVYVMVRFALDGAWNEAGLAALLALLFVGAGAFLAHTEKDKDP